MRIAFDLDDTIIPGRVPFLTDPIPRNWFVRPFCREPIRRGTVELFNALWRAGHEVSIYTTSFRNPWTIRFMFWAYGTRVKEVVNETIHRRRMKRLGDRFKLCTKLPPAFQFDLLIDDCGAVLHESQQFCFEMLQVLPNDEDFVEKVRQRVGI